MLDCNHTFQGGGTHTLKGGFGIQHTLNNVNSVYPGGYVDIFWGAPGQAGSTLSLPGQAADRGAFGYYAVNNRGIFGKAGADILSLYVQDQWQIADRLTWNIGVRIENENVPAYRTEVRKNVFEFGWREKLAPRLGFSYDVIGHRPRKALCQLGPLLRLDQVRDAARFVWRRHLVHLVPRNR